jgi:two-component SAPR family response regulator
VQGARVLVVDDDTAIREMLGQWLKEEGFAPSAAANGREAVARLESADGPPDIMLLDLVMPEMSGYDVLEYLRRNLLQQFPVLVFSAQRPDASLLTALDSELRDFIAKPFELAELLVRMQRLLQRSPRFAPSRSGLLRVYALGTLRIYRDDALVFDESWRNKPAKTIFKLLFTNAGQRYPKDALAEELWPETEPDAAANRLRVAIHELRKMLGEKGNASHVSQQEGAYYFDPTVPYWSDTKAFIDFVEQGRALSREKRLEEALQAYRSAEALYQGDYMRDDPYLEWTVATRERLREAHLLMLSDTAQIYAELGEPNEAAAFCRKIVRIEPWREEVYRRLMEYLVAAGRPHEALRAFEECRRALRAEIEANPSPETVRLRDAISRQQSAVGG